MSDKNNACCCDDPSAPSISGGGNDPATNDTGPQKIMLTGSAGTSPDGQAIARAVPVGPNGMKVELFEMPGGITGTEVRDDGVTLLWKNGRALSWSADGSSGSSFTPGSV